MPGKMTDGPRSRRLPRWALRSLAWVTGGLAFLSPFVGLTISPKPSSADQDSSERVRRYILVRRITKRMIVRPTPERQAVRYVYVGGGSSGGSSGSGGSAVAAPAPTTTTGGS